MWCTNAYSYDFCIIGTNDSYHQFNIFPKLCVNSLDIKINDCLLILIFQFLVLQFKNTYISGKKIAFFGTWIARFLNYFCMFSWKKALSVCLFKSHIFLPISVDWPNSLQGWLVDVTPMIIPSSLSLTSGWNKRKDVSDRPLLKDLLKSCCTDKRNMHLFQNNQ